MHVLGRAEESTQCDLADPTPRDLVVDALPVRERQEPLDDQIPNSGVTLGRCEEGLSAPVYRIPQQVKGFRKMGDMGGVTHHATTVEPPTPPEGLDQLPALHTRPRGLVGTRVHFVPSDITILRHQFAGIKRIAVHVGVPVVVEQVAGIDGSEADEDGGCSPSIPVFARHPIGHGERSGDARHVVGLVLTDRAHIGRMDFAPGPGEGVPSCGEFGVAALLRADVVGEGLAGPEKVEPTGFLKGLIRHVRTTMEADKALRIFVVPFHPIGVIGLADRAERAIDVEGCEFGDHRIDPGRTARRVVVGKCQHGVPLGFCPVVPADVGPGDGEILLPNPQAWMGHGGRTLAVSGLEVLYPGATLFLTLAVPGWHTALLVSDGYLHGAVGGQLHGDQPVIPVLHYRFDIPVHGIATCCFVELLVHRGLSRQV